MRTKRLAGLTSLFLAIIMVTVASWTYSPVFSSVDQAKAKCGLTIWMVERDAVFFDITKHNLADTDELERLRQDRGEDGRAFVCSRHEADRLVTFEKVFQAGVYLFFISLWLPVCTAATVIWWLYHEAKHFWLKRLKK